MSGPSAEVRRTLLETIESQRLGCELAGSPLYADVLTVVADDVERQGPIDRVLAPVADAPYGDAVLLRLLSGLHRVVLDGRAPALARFYPSVGGGPDAGSTAELAAAVATTVEQHHDELAVRLGEGVQTNEVGRSAAMVGGYLEVAAMGLPLRVLEVGASAGLNLLFDRYRYDAVEGGLGPTDSPLAFDRPWVSATPRLDVDLVVAERRGSDVAPIDCTSDEGRQRLRSFVWADQPERLARLDAAVAVGRHDPPTVDRASAAAWAVEQLAEPVAGVATVLSHSIVLQYLGAGERRELLGAIEGAGARASAQAPVAWLRLEPGGDQAELRLTTWPGGRSRLLATSAYHGPPVAWRRP